MISLLLFSVVAAAKPLRPEVLPTPVLSRTIERGDIFSSRDFVIEDRTVSQARGGLAPEAAEGLEASRRVSAGSVLRAGDALTPRLVKRGEPVTVRVRSGSLTISTSGRALADGRRGDVVRIVASTNRTLEGVVEGTGAVRVTAP